VPMGAALALAIALVVVVGVVSLVFNSQGQLPGAQRVSSPPRSAGEGPQKKKDRASGAPKSASSAKSQVAKPFKRARPERAGRVQGGGGDQEGERFAEPDQVFGDLRPLNRRAVAVVLSVVDERVLGPVTRCKLTLRVEPEGEESFEVTTRVAFPTPEQRASVKVGGQVPVRYDADDHHRVVVEIGGPNGG
jgi:hypothetical protein